MEWFGRCAIQPNHFKSEDRMATPFLGDHLFVDNGLHEWITLGSAFLLTKPLLISSAGQSGLAISI